MRKVDPDIQTIYIRELYPYIDISMWFFAGRLCHDFHPDKIHPRWNKTGKVERCSLHIPIAIDSDASNWPLECANAGIVEIPIWIEHGIKRSRE